MYNLDMSSRDNWMILHLPSGTICEPDTTQVVNDKHPFHILGDSHIIPYHSKIDFHLWGQVLLPEVQSWSECELSVIIRADTLSAPIYFDAEIIDKDETVIVSARSSINHLRDTWQVQTLKLPGLTDINELRIILRYQGKSSDREEFWIDRFVIRVNGEDIGEWDVAERLHAIPAVLDHKYTVPLDFSNDKVNIASRISGLGKQRFVTLSASTYGSLSIQQARLRTCRDLILKHGVNYLIFEADMFNMLALDMYVNGHDIDNIGSYLNYYGSKDPFSGPEFIRFVEWVREYNRTHKHKVHLFGTEHANYRLDKFISDIKSMVSGDDISLEVGCLAIVRRLRNDDNLQKKLGNEMFAILVNTIECAEFMWSRSGYIDPERTGRIFWYITALDKNIIPQNGRAAIIANCDHIRCIYTADNPCWDRARLGHFMREKYGDNYFSIAFLPGRGKYLQDCYPDQRGQFADSLQTPVAGSFENAAMNTGLEYLYYPSSHLDDNTVYMMDIARGGRYLRHYRLRALGKRHDGYIFVRDNLPKEVISPEELGSWNPPKEIKLFLYYNKQIQHNNFATGNE